MKNASLEIVKSKIKISITGRNINRFILRLRKARIALLNIEKKTREEVNIIVYFADYERILELNTVYEISIIEYGGWIYGKKSLKRNSYIIISILIALTFLFILSKMIFKVEVVTNNTEMKNIILEELNKYNITPFHFQKGYKKIEEIKAKILEDYKEEIEWIEIQSIGTKYIVRYEPRLLPPKEEVEGDRHIVARKNAIIIEVDSSKGQVIRRQNDYVKKGDIIVSGYIYLHDEVKDIVSASGTVYGEVWYEVEVFYPFGYYEQTRTGNKKQIYSFKFLNWKTELFNFKPYKDKIIDEQKILSDRALPIRFSKETHEEVNTISSIYTLEEATIRGIDLAKNKIEASLNENEAILKYRVMEQIIKNNGVSLRVFFSVREDITDYAKAEPLEKEKSL